MSKSASILLLDCGPAMADQHLPSACNILFQILHSKVKRSTSDSLLNASSLRDEKRIKWELFIWALKVIVLLNYLP
jgi:hypothetical protein